MNTPNIGHRPVSRENVTRAVLLICLAGLSFSMVGVAVRLSGDVPLYEKVFFRSVFSLVATAAIAAKYRSNPFARSPRTPMLILRGVFGTTAMTFYFYAVEHLPLGDATILNKLSPFFVVLFAVLFLKERLSRYALPALVCALAGAIMVVKPRLDVSVGPAAAGVLSAAASGAAYTVVRSLRGKEPPFRIVFFFALVSSVAMVPPMLARYVAPSPRELLLLLGAGLFATTGQLALTLAYHQAQATKISIYNYAHVVFAFVLGFALWGEVPDLVGLCGAALIVGAAFYNHRRVVSERVVPPPA